MKKESGHPKAREFLDSLAASGRLTFSSADALKVLGTSQAAAEMALSRMRRQKLIVSPAKGFHVRLPAEFRAVGCPPAEQFVPDLMEHLRIPYYAGLLTAAQYHGAAHQQPMQFQVFVEKPRRPLTCGRVRVVFIVRKNLALVPIEQRNTRQGRLNISTPEATAFDLIGYPHRAAGFSNVTTVLSELAEQLDSRKLVATAAAAPAPWVQRLGYVLEHVGAGDKADGLRELVRENAYNAVALLPAKPHDRTARDATWRVYANAAVEAAT